MEWTILGGMYLRCGIEALRFVEKKTYFFEAVQTAHMYVQYLRLPYVTELPININKLSSPMSFIGNIYNNV